MTTAKQEAGNTECPEHSFVKFDDRLRFAQYQRSNNGIQLEFECTDENRVKLGISYPLSDLVPQGLEDKVLIEYNVVNREPFEAGAVVLHE